MLVALNRKFCKALYNRIIDTLGVRSYNKRNGFVYNEFTFLEHLHEICHLWCDRKLRQDLIERAGKYEYNDIALEDELEARFNKNPVRMNNNELHARLLEMTICDMIDDYRIRFFGYTFTKPLENLQILGDVFKNGDVICKYRDIKIRKALHPKNYLECWQDWPGDSKKARSKVNSPALKKMAKDMISYLFRKPFDEIVNRYNYNANHDRTNRRDRLPF